jgi:hypothetical protein
MNTCELCEELTENLYRPEDFNVLICDVCYSELQTHYMLELELEGEQ